MDSKQEVLSEPVLVGREKELAKLSQYLDSVTEGRGTTVFISGEAGSGKTRLINEFVKTLIRKNMTILSGWCLSNAGLPYFPFIEAFSSYLPSNETANNSINQQSSKKWLKETDTSRTLQNEEPAVAQVWKDQAFEAVTSELLSMAAARKVILVLEDMHWADSGSLALLHYISRATICEPILILVTFRSEELGGFSEIQTSPLAETIHLMGRESLFHQINLSNLDKDSVKKISECMLGGEVEQSFAEKLYMESHGNPLFVVESLRMLSEGDNLVLDNGRWGLSTDDMGIPSKVKEVILRRIGALKPSQKRILDVASVIGDKFDPELLGAVLSQDSLQILEALNTILQSTSLLRVEQNSYKFDHAKLREVLYEGISVPLRQGYHSRIAQTIENKRGEIKDPLFGRIAYHYAQAGNLQKAIEYSLAAGLDALKRFSNLEAVEHFKYVLQALEDAETNLDEKVAALEGLGDAYFASCLFEDAIKTFEILANATAGVIKLRAYRKEMEAIWYKEEDSIRLLALVEEAKKHAALDPIEDARILWNKARAIMWQGKMEEALADHRKALKIFEEEYSLPDVAQLAFGLGVNYLMIGLENEKGVCQVLRSIAIFNEIGDARGEILASLIGGGECFMLCGLFEECYQVLANVVKIGERIGDYDDLAQAWFRLSDIPENEGNLNEAISQCLRALEYSEKTDTKGTQCKIYARLTELYALNGDLEKAEQYYARLMDIPAEIRLHPRIFFHVAYPLSVFFALKGEWTEAEKYSRQDSEFVVKMYPNGAGLQFLARKHRAWLFSKQGKAEAARMEVEEANGILEKIEKKFKHACIQATLIAPKEMQVGKESEIRLDIINSGRKPCSLYRVEGVTVPNFRIETRSNEFMLQNEFLEFKGECINPFKVKTLKLRFIPARSGEFNLAPMIIYVDDLGKTKNFNVGMVSINVKQSFPASEQNTREAVTAKFEIRSAVAQRVFDYLVRAFVEDYNRKQLSKEKSGWRTLTDLSKHGAVSLYSVYGSPGHRGLAISELERLGAVEIRFFPGERGRGGKITKLRVAVENPGVKSCIDQALKRQSIG